MVAGRNGEPRDKTRSEAWLRGWDKGRRLRREAAAFHEGHWHTLHLSSRSYRCFLKIVILLPNLLCSYLCLRRPHQVIYLLELSSMRQIGVTSCAW
jgi:hypothetical protein